MMRTLATIGLLFSVLLPAGAADCPGNPDALGTERILAVDPAKTPPVGRKQFPGTLPLAPREVVLTFDDGPVAGPTDQVLAALKRECVRATFFMLGRNAAAHPAVAKKVLADGHTIGHHSFSHPLLSKMSLARAEAEIDHGIAAVDAAVYGEPGGPPRTPFFRFPGFAGSPALLELLAKRGIAVFGADLWASDWNPMTPAAEHTLVMRRLTQTNGGILLLHDPVPQTVRMLPELLRDMKRRGFRVVHIVPTG